MDRRYEVVSLLRLLVAILAVGAGWFAFRAPTATETAQVGASHCPTGYTYNVMNLCYVGESSGASGSLGSLLGPLPVGQGVSTVATMNPVSFSCFSVWDTWIVKTPYSSSGTTYADLTGTWSPDYKIYDEPYSAASLSCINSNRGRVHIFWTLIVIATLVFAASEVIRRDLLRES